MLLVLALALGWVLASGLALVSASISRVAWVRVLALALKSGLAWVWVSGLGTGLASDSGLESQTRRKSAARTR